LTHIINSVGKSGAPAQSAKVVQRSINPKKGVVKFTTGKVHKANNLTSVIEIIREAVCAPEAAQVEHPPVLPQKWPLFWRRSPGVGLRLHPFRRFDLFQILACRPLFFLPR